MDKRIFSSLVCPWLCPSCVSEQDSEHLLKQKDKKKKKKKRCENQKVRDMMTSSLYIPFNKILFLFLPLLVSPLLFLTRWEGRSEHLDYAN
jgi:hypothetical protein